MSEDEAKHYWVDNFKLLGIFVAVCALTVLVLDGGSLFSSRLSHVEDAVAAKMRDPSSVQFREIFGSGEVYCGQVNGKNGYGAYAGFREFVYKKGTVLLKPEEPTLPDRENVVQYNEDVALFYQLMQQCYG